MSWPKLSTGEREDGMDERLSPRDSCADSAQIGKADSDCGRNAYRVEVSPAEPEGPRVPSTPAYCRDVT